MRVPRVSSGRPIGTALALAGLLALGACGPKPGDGLAKAKTLIQANNRQAAIVQLKSVIQSQPQLAEARFLLGQQLLAGGDPVAAEIELRRALELHQPEPQAVPVLARALLATGQHKKLIEQFGGVRWPEQQATAELKTSLAQAQAKLGDLNAARNALDLALQAAPDYEMARLLQARLMAAGGDVPAAQAAVQTWLDAHPQSTDAWLLKGELLARGAHDAAGAREAWLQAIGLQPSRPEGHVALISLLVAQRDVTAAQAQFEVMKKALPNHPQTLLFEGQMAFVRGDLARANELFQGLLSKAPNNLLLLQSAGAVALQLKSPAQAESLLSKALQLAPEAKGTRRLLAQTQLSLGQPKRALALLEPLIGKGSTDADALSLAAQARLLDGQAAQASELFERAGKARPDDPRIRTAVALGHLSNASRQDDPSALAELQSVAATDPGSSADLALISTYLRRRDFEAALQAIAGLEKKQPDSAMPGHLRGQVLLLKKDTAGARAAFEQAVARDDGYFPPVAALAGLDLNDNKPEVARGRFEALLTRHPGHAGARMALAELATRTGATREQVADLLQEAVKANPADPAPRLALVDHHLATANPKAALAAAQAALTVLPDHFDLLARQGQSQLATGDHRQAINTYSRMVTLQGKSPVGYLHLAEAQLAADDASAAARTVKRVLEIAPDSPVAYRLGVAAALRQNNTTQALQYAKEVQRLHPDQAEGQLLEGDIQIGQKRWDAAIPPLRKALQLADPGQAPARLHQALRGAGKVGEADAFATSWLHDHPKDALFQFYLGDVAVARRDFAGAEQAYQAVLKQLPDHALSLNNIAWLMLEQKKPGALPFAERAVRAAPNRPALMDTLALAYAAENQTARAIELQKQVLAMRPDDPFMRFNLARFYAQAGEKRLAKAELDRLGALGERFPRQDDVASLSKSLGGR